jgi:Uncharacterized protein conserved in bacteria (DUF2330)
MRQWIGALTVGLAVTVIGVGPAAACGFLVAPNGAVNLLRTSTLAAYHDGMEHYVTSFQFAGSPGAFGSIIPLPGAPTKVERGGDWTLQRLVREVQVGARAQANATPAAAGAATSVTVLERTQIDALDLAVLKGGAADVVAWANDNGFALPGDTVPSIDFYARRSPYFMVARFDAEAAKARGLNGGDGIPVHLTIPVDNPWVPLRILATAKEPEDLVQADVFLLTDSEPAILSTPGPQIAVSERASTALLADLRSDKGMDWVPSTGWLTYVRIDASAARITGDLAVDARGGTPSLDATGLTASTAVHLRPGTGDDSSAVTWVAVAGVIVVVAAATLGWWAGRGRRYSADGTA